MTPRATHRDRGLFRAWLLVLVLAPIANRATERWSWPFLAAVIFLLGLWGLAIERKTASKEGGDGHPTARKPDDLENAERTGWRLWTVFWLAWLTWTGFQLIPLPPAVIAWASPGLDGLYRDAWPGYGQGGWHTLAVAPAGAVFAMLLLCACATGFWLTARLCGSRRRMGLVIVTMLLVGVGEAAYGLAVPRESLRAPASGTFINRNHFATFIGMTLMLAVGALLARWNRLSLSRQAAVQQTLGVETAKGKSPPAKLGLWITLGILFLVGGVLSSYSRAGNVTVLLVCGLLAVLWAHKHRIQWIKLGAVVAGIVGLVLALGGYLPLETLTARLLAVDTDLESSRLPTWERTVDLIQQVPVVGVGLGGFNEAFTRVVGLQDGFQNKLWVNAHSDLLQLMAESGMLGAGIVTAGLAVYVVMALRCWGRRKDPFVVGLGLGCLGAIIVACLHSAVDYPLRTPAIALYVSVLLALGWRILHSRDVPGENSWLWSRRGDRKTR